MSSGSLVPGLQVAVDDLFQAIRPKRMLLVVVAVVVGCVCV